jgi:hypothetical protein
MVRILLLLWTTVLLFPVSLAAQAATEWRDPLADRMTGTWKLEGQVMGKRPIKRYAPKEIKLPYSITALFAFWVREEQETVSVLVLAQFGVFTESTSSPQRTP